MDRSLAESSSGVYENRATVPLRLGRALRMLEFPWLKIRGKLLIAFLFVLAPLFIVHALYLKESYEREKRTLLLGQVQTAQAIASTVRAFISDLVTREQWVAQFIAEAGDDLGEVRHRLTDLRAGYSFITSAAYLSIDGATVVVDPPMVLETDPIGASYLRPIVEGQVRWSVSDLLLNQADGLPAWAVAAAVGDEVGRLKGVIVATLTPRAFEKAVVVDISRQGSYAIVDSNGRAVYVSNHPDLPWEARDWTWMPHIDASLAGRQTTFDGIVSRIDSVRRLGGTALIPDIGWMVGVAVPEDEVLNPVRAHVVAELLTLVLVGLLSVAVGLFAASYFTNNLRKLSSHAGRLASGNFDLQVDIQTHDEMQEVADAFNEMARRLRERENENLRLIADLRQAEVRRKELLSVVGHDLKTPLTVIKAWADLALIEAEKGVLRKREAEASRIIRSQVAHMLHLIDQLLDAAKADAGELGLCLELADVVSIARNMIDSLQATTTEHSLYLAGEEHIEVFCDRARFEQVLNNLISNAIKYSPSGEIEIRLETWGEMVHCAVRDEGIGIPEEQQPYVFDRFYRVDPRRRGEGLGLGLYICNQIIQQHGGRMWVESAVGKGSTFHFVIPKGPTNVSCCLS